MTYSQKQTFSQPFSYFTLSLQDDYDGPVREINLENLADEARENDGSGTHTTGAGRTTGPRAQAMAEKPKGRL